MAVRIRAATGDGSQFGLRITYIEQDEPLGLAHCVVIARDFLGDDDFLMYLGDNVVPDGISTLVSRFRARRSDAMVLLGPVPNPTEYGVAEVGSDGRVLGLEEKSPTPSSDLAMIGIYAFTPAIHRAVRSIEPSWRGERRWRHRPCPRSWAISPRPAWWSSWRSWVSSPRPAWWSSRRP